MGVDVKEGGGLTSRWGRQRGWGSHEWVWTSKGVEVSRVGVDVKGGGESHGGCGRQRGWGSHE